MNSYNSIDEIRDILIPLGFKEFSPPPLASYDGVYTMFQKRYDDDLGKRYFIDAKVWDWSWTNRIPENYHIEYEGQFYQKGTHNAVNFTFIDWTFSQVEEWLQKLFDQGFIEHYEKWD